MRVLVVEDEEILRNQIVNLLKLEGYQVSAEADGQAGLYQASEQDYSLLILDIGLPKLTGLELIQKLRKTGNSTPILVLSARDKWHEKVEGLTIGADDYLAKPFNHDELLARVAALLRRSSGLQNNAITYGPLKLNLASQLAYFHDTVIHLTAFEFRLLEALMARPNKVLSKVYLIDKVYEDREDTDSNVLEVLVARNSP